MPNLEDILLLTGPPTCLEAMEAMKKGEMCFTAVPMLSTIELPTYFLRPDPAPPAKISRYIIDGHPLRDDLHTGRFVSQFGLLGLIRTREHVVLRGVYLEHCVAQKPTLKIDAAANFVGEEVEVLFDKAILVDKDTAHAWFPPGTEVADPWTDE